MAPPSPRATSTSSRKTAAKKPRAPRKTAASKKTRAPKKAAASKKTRAPKKVTATKRPTAAKKPRARRKPAAPRAKRTTTAQRPSGSWRRWLITEAMVWGMGASVGLAIAGGFLWQRARQDVSAYLAHPPRSIPGVIYSAPMTPRKGQRLRPVELAGDLLAAGYERVDGLDGPSQFNVDHGVFHLWTAPSRGVTGGRATVRIAGDRVIAVQPADAVLSPTVLATIGDPGDRRTTVVLSALSKWMEPALLAMEDANFRQHHGVDPLGVLRAVGHNLSGRGELHGGSTLTQQLAKNLFLSPERTLRRKLREALFAAALETEIDKDGLLQLYLGEVYLGQVGGVPIHGVEQAARAWFGVSASRLSLGQAATIAGIISAPNRYAPSRHPARAKTRRDLVLDRMVSTGTISASQADTAKAEALRIDGQLPGAIRRAPWIVDAAVDAAEDKLGTGSLAFSGGQVHTTLQPALQHAAEAAVAAGMAQLDKDYPKAAGAQVALVAVRVRDGAVVAMVGGRDYHTSPFNRATHAWRQAGSTVKPLTLLAAFEADPRLSPVSRVHDDPVTLTLDGKPWTPRNYDGNFQGEISLRHAIEASRNIPAVLLAEDVGFSKVKHAYREAGLTRASGLPSASLGAFEATALELAGAYTVFPGGGQVASPRILSYLADANGQLVRAEAPTHKRLASPASAALATTVLQGVITHGTGRRALSYNVRGPVGGKTGTTSDYRDAWFVGFTPELAVAVWVGRDKGTLGLSGSRAALPTWSRFIAASGTLGGSLPKPESVVEAMVCTSSGGAVRNACPAGQSELFRADQLPALCPDHGSPVVEVGRSLLGWFSRHN